MLRDRAAGNRTHSQYENKTLTLTVSTGLAPRPQKADPLSRALRAVASDGDQATAPFGIRRVTSCATAR